MKVLMKPVQMIAWFDEQGKITPVRFKMSIEDGSVAIVKIKHINGRKEEKLLGNRLLVFTCQGEVSRIERLLELKYELNSCKWFLSKM